MEYDNTNRGALFRQDEKKSDDDRDYAGTLNVDGTEYWLSGWLKTSKKGTKYMSLSVKPKEAPPQQKSDDDGFGHKSSLSRGDMDDEIPF
jgi:hypothetical protein